jgi:hypothetical protein
MARRFFVTVVAPSKHALVSLSEFDLDLFQPTARVTEQNDFAIDGLLTLEEIGRLVEEGYRVVVNEEASKKARARTEVAEFRQWIRGIEEE